MPGAERDGGGEVAQVVDADGRQGRLGGQLAEPVEDVLRSGVRTMPYP